MRIWKYQFVRWMVDVKSTYSQLQFSDFLVEIASGKNRGCWTPEWISASTLQFTWKSFTPFLFWLSIYISREGKEEDVKRGKESVRDEGFRKITPLNFRGNHHHLPEPCANVCSASAIIPQILLLTIVSLYSKFVNVF